MSVLFVSLVGLCCVVNGVRNFLLMSVSLCVGKGVRLDPMYCLVCVCSKRAKRSCFVSECVASVT